MKILSILASISMVISDLWPDLNCVILWQDVVIPDFLFWVSSTSAHWESQAENKAKNFIYRKWMNSILYSITQCFLHILRPLIICSTVDTSTTCRHGVVRASPPTNRLWGLETIQLPGEAVCCGFLYSYNKRPGYILDNHGGHLHVYF